MVEQGQFIRLAGSRRCTVRIRVDGVQRSALEGDTLLTALLLEHDAFASSEPGGRLRAGFCLMGACQECWVRSADGTPLRACSTLVSDGMSVVIEAPGTGTR